MQNTKIRFCKEGIDIITEINTIIKGKRPHTETIGYNEFPADGFRLTISGIHPEINDDGTLVGIVLDIDDFEMLKKSRTGPNEVRLELPPAAITYGYFPMKKTYREFFPGFKEPFILETPVGNIRTQVVGDFDGTPVGDREGGRYISRLKKIYDQLGIEAGTIAIIKEIKSKEKYQLQFE